jgi:invasion protein IalB
MIQHTTFLTVTLAVATLAAVAGAQPSRPSAQPVPPPPPAVPADPERTTASFGDWLLRCERAGDQRVCEVAQTLVLQGQQQPIAVIAIGRLQRGQPLTLTIQAPVSVTIANPMKVVSEEREPVNIDAVWRRCQPNGCFADVQLRDEALLRRLRTRNDPGRLEFRDAAGQDIRLPFSFRGLGPALDALGREQ